MASTPALVNSVAGDPVNWRHESTSVPLLHSVNKAQTGAPAMRLLQEFILTIFNQSWCFGSIIFRQNLAKVNALPLVVGFLFSVNISSICSILLLRLVRSWKWEEWHCRTKLLPAESPTALSQLSRYIWWQHPNTAGVWHANPRRSGRQLGSHPFCFTPHINGRDTKWLPAHSRLFYRHGRSRTTRDWFSLI